jgi:hypothetical protein
VESRQSPVIRTFAHRTTNFAHQNHIIPLSLQGSAHNLLGPTLTVEIRSIDKIAAQIQCAVNRPNAHLVIFLFPECRSQTDR